MGNNLCYGPRKYQETLYEKTIREHKEGKNVKINSIDY